MFNEARLAIEEGEDAVLSGKSFIRRGPATREKELLVKEVEYLTNLLVLMCTERGFGQDGNLEIVRAWFRNYLIDSDLDEKAKRQEHTRIRSIKLEQFNKLKEELGIE